MVMPSMPGAPLFAFTCFQARLRFALSSTWLNSASGLTEAPPFFLRTQSSPALSPELPPRLHQWASLCCASSPHRVGLLSGSCSSAHGFRIVFFQKDGHPPPLDLCWYSVFHFHGSGFHTGDLNPIWTAPMLGTHKARLGNRWGCSVGQDFRNFHPPSRLDAHPRPSGASA
jgi:hypothetical protein